MNRKTIFLTLAATFFVSAHAYAQTGGPIPAITNRLAVMPQVANDSAMARGTSIRIICASSIKSGSEPLCIVDGHVSEMEELKTLNPNDIAKVEVLKGVSATALYGSRATNGVVIITMKK